MTWATLFLFLFVVFLVCLYFLPYKKLKGKIFKKLFPDTSSVKAVSYTRGDFSVSFERDAQRWRMVSPAVWQADTVKMRRLMLRLSELDVDERLSGKNPDDPLYLIGRNGTLELDSGTSRTALSFGSYDESGDHVYVVKSGDGDILSVNASILSALPSDADDFKRRLLFEEAYSNIRYVEAVMDGKSYLMTKTDAGWVMNGKNIFDEKARPFVEGLLEIEGDRFIGAGTKLPPKHAGLITMKAVDKAVSRYFFTVPEFEDEYLVPMEGEILLVPKAAVKAYFAS